MIQTLTSFDIDLVEVLHLEITTKCNARCLLCRRYDDTLYDPNSDQSDINVEFIQTHIPVNFIKRLSKILLCGNFGDPAASSNCINIIKYFKTINPNITVGMHSNGGVQSPTWWRGIAALLSSPTDYVVFSIDGLEDTNHIYRVGVKWDKLITNVKAFIGGGGNAQWDMLVYKHNEHQVDQAINLARDLGFSCFRSKMSGRDIPKTVNLRFPTDYVKFSPQDDTVIKCHALEERSIYISANGLCLPCCFFGVKSNFKLDKIWDFLSESKINLNTTSIGAAVSTFISVESSWTAQPIYMCRQVCGKSASNETLFSDQWKNSIQFKN